jgi:dTDP-4-amino-4,6-dideoxygalactose transaminase
VQGRWVSLLERVAAAAFGVPLAVACSNGTAALHLGCRAVGLTGSHNAVVPANSFIATALAPLYCGAEVRLADVDPETLNVTRETILAVCDANTRLIMPVELGGSPCAWEELVDLPAPVLLDAAHSHGTKYRGKPTAALATLAATSFFPSKVLGGNAEGGLVLSGEESHGMSLRSLRRFGEVEKHEHARIGYNYKMSELAAAYMCGVFDEADWILSERRRIADAYHEGIRFEPLGLTRIRIPPGGTPNWYLYVVRTETPALRDRLRNHLVGRGIGITDSTYKRTINRHAAWPQSPTRYSVNHAERAMGCLLCLPIWPGMCAANIAHVIDALNSFAK